MPPLFHALFFSYGHIFRCRHFFNTNIFFRKRQVQSIANSFNHMLRRTQNKQFPRPDSSQCPSHNLRIRLFGENSRPHSLHTIGIILSRMTCYNSITIDKKTVINNSLYFSVICYDQSVMAFSRTARADKSYDLHALQFPSYASKSATLPAGTVNSPNSSGNRPAVP